MNRKDWLYVALHLITIIMLLLAFNSLFHAHENVYHIKKHSDQEQAFRECECIKDAKKLVDNPVFYEVVSPETTEAYKEIAELWPLIEKSYQRAHQSTMNQVSMAKRAFGKEGYCEWIAERLGV